MKIVVNSLLLLTILTGCKKSSQVETDPNFVEVRATYNNMSGNPSITFQAGDLPVRIKLDAEPVFSLSTDCKPSRVCLDLKNVRFQEKNSAYEIIRENTETFEIVDGRPIRDMDNMLTSHSLRTLDYVLVLDIGRSLEANEALIKQYAEGFINQIASNRETTSRIGLVVFSDQIETLPLTADYASAIRFLKSRTGGEETKLYQAVDAGLGLLENSVAEGKSIVLFTDGINNSWTDSKLYQHINYVRDKIRNPVNKGLVSTFTIGLKTHPTYSPDESALAALTQNGGVSMIAKNTIELKIVFNKVATSINSAYHLTYSRNNSKLNQPIELVFKFQFKPI